MENREGTGVLILYYSFSNQTRRMVHVAKEVLRDEGYTFYEERIRPKYPLTFPVNSILDTFILMIKTFFRWRVPIYPLSERALKGEFNLVVLAGPTWSYNPSGPILSLLDLHGQELFKATKVLPLISCRSYWKRHYTYLRGRIQSLGGAVLPPIVLRHPLKEPWKTLGVFFTIAGKNPRRLPLLRNRYVQYGHTKEQLEGFRLEFKKVLREIHVKAKAAEAGRRYRS